MRTFILLFVLLIGFKVSYADKHALIIAIGNYPERTKWSTINSLSDVTLIKNALLRQQFNEKNIIVLEDATATKKGILRAFDELFSKIKSGDIVVIHYSGHGQQIFDDNGDEADGLDEAIVPYDAVRFSTMFYNGENHIRDDEIEVLVNKIRKKLGKKGQLLMTFDSCHSGTATRGNTIYRGSTEYFKPYGKPNWTPLKNSKDQTLSIIDSSTGKDNFAPFIFISGAEADQLNSEAIVDGEHVGSLSYAFSEVLNNVNEDFTYRQLFAAIQSKMYTLVPGQTPTIEGDVDIKVFGDEFIIPDRSFAVLKKINNDTLLIRGGKADMLYEHTSIMLMPGTSLQADSAQAISFGTVVSSDFASATVQLSKPLESNDYNIKKYKVFVDQPSYASIQIRVFIDESIGDSKLKEQINSALRESSVGEVTEKLDLANVIVYSLGNEIRMISNGAKDDFYQVHTSDFSVRKLVDVLLKYAHGDYLKRIVMNDQSMAFSFELVPVKRKELPNGNIEIETIANKDVFYKNNILQIVPDKDTVVLKIKNNGDKAIYISIIEINSKGEWESFFPHSGCKINNDERKIEPGSEREIRKCIYKFNPPYEKLTLKAFASEEPIYLDFSDNSKRGGNMNPLERFVANPLEFTRSGSATTTQKTLRGYTNEIIYEIIKKRQE
ncbi:MAG: caspase family protein [Bacteroidales bacterium]